jgi:hypothetical protein
MAAYTQSVVDGENEVDDLSDLSDLDDVECGGAFADQFADTSVDDFLPYVGDDGSDAA